MNANNPQEVKQRIGYPIQESFLDFSDFIEIIDTLSRFCDQIPIPIT